MTATAIVSAAGTAFSDFAVTGVPASGAKAVNKGEVRALFALIDAALASLGVNGAITVKKATRAALYADLSAAADTLAVVYNDTIAAQNGIYIKIGGTGLGSWSLTALALPASFATDLATVLAQMESVYAAEVAADGHADRADAAADQAEAIQALVETAQAASQAAAAQSVAAAEAHGDFNAYDTKADATAAVGGLADGALVRVWQDESQSDHQTIYAKESGALVLKADLDLPAARLGVHATRAAAAASFIPSATTNIRTAGYANAGDGGEAIYSRALSEPSHAGKFQSADGAWWELCSQAVTSAMFGVPATPASLNAALAFSAGRTLTILPGEYDCDTTTLTVPAAATVLAEGATLTWDDHVTAVQLGAGARWRGGALEGPGDGTVYDADGYGMVCAGTENSEAAPTFIAGPDISGVTISGFGYAGIWCEYVDGGTVTENFVRECGYVGIAAISPLGIHVDRNNVKSIKGVGAPDTYGIFYSAYEGSELENPRAERSSICNNIIDDIPNHEGIDLHGDVQMVINDNVLTRVKTGIAVVGGDTLTVASRGCQQVVVSGNVVEGLGTGDNITVSGTTPERARSIVISSNVLKNGGTVDDIYAGAIRVVSGDAVAISGNVIESPWVFGINLIGAIGSLNVSGNVIVNPRNNGAFTAPSCIAVSGGDISGLIAGNTFVYDEALAVDDYVAVRSIFVFGSLTGLDLTLGKNAFVGLDETHLTMALSTVTGVDYAEVMTQNGVGTLAITNASTALLAVTFPKRFPSVPTGVFLTVSGSLVPGTVGKMAHLNVQNVTEEGFEILARPYDLTTFGGAGDLAVNWRANT